MSSPPRLPIEAPLPLPELQQAPPPHHEELQASSPPPPTFPPPPMAPSATTATVTTTLQEPHHDVVNVAIDVPAPPDNTVLVNGGNSNDVLPRAHAPDETSDSESIRLQRDVSRRQSEGFVAFNKGFDACEVTPEATNPVKKDTTTKQGRVNLSPMTPLKSIAGQSVQVLKIDDLRMFCSRNGIKGSRKAKKADICWAICKAKAAYFAGHAPPFQGLIPANETPEDEDVVGHSFHHQHSLLGDDAWAGGDVIPERKRRRVDDVNDGGVVPKSEFPFASFPAGTSPATASPGYPRVTNAKQQTQQQHISLREEQMMLQRRLVKSREDTNDAIRLREMIESAATLRREIREEKDRRAPLWKEFVDAVGDESLATNRVKEYRAATGSDEVKGSYETLIENVIELDDLVKQITAQHKALNEAIDKLVPKEEENESAGEIKAAEGEGETSNEDRVMV